ncbi:hypothetical protein AMJ57_03960 [Parcubacteria bacterium SG8_24]|nr:MAG: hypothetical protein AMJ57_03960 [Parcubacteria bacterium SG8_24]
MRILAFGDIMGRIGRTAVKEVLPELRREIAPDLVLANGENLARGKGITPNTIREMHEAGIDLFTTGNHVWNRKEYHEVMTDPELRELVIRPANYPPDVPGRGSKILTIGTKNVLVINLLGRVFGEVHCRDPFRTFDGLLEEHADRNPAAVLVDFHAEATSEKVAFGWYVDGRASAVWGTHTHIPTRDERILPGGTAYITDVGMCGFADGVLGITKEPVLRHFLTQLPVRHEIPERGPTTVEAVVVTLESDGRAGSIGHVRRALTIE